MPKPNFISKADKITEIIRVDHAGEYGAKRIYEGQIKFTRNLENKILINSMLEQELVHLNYFEEQLKVRNVRPTIFMPLWNIGGYALGAISASIGLRPAMLVTEAIESVIEKHYAKQLEYLKDIAEEKDLLEKIKEFREDELEHKTIALDHESAQTRFANITFNFVKLICMSAIFLSKKL